MKPLKLLSIIRFHDWWNYIIPPVLLFYGLGLLLIDTSKLKIINIFVDYLYFLALTTCTAAIGFYINEWTDIRDDKIAKKNNHTEGTTLFQRLIILILILLCIIYTSTKIHWSMFSFSLLIFQFSLFILYSVYPLRLKRFKYVAIILDALYSGTIFYIIAISIASANTVNIRLVLSIFLWGVCKGVRTFILHLIKDRTSDKLLDFDTIATTNSAVKLNKIILHILLPLELILHLSILLALPYALFFILIYLVFLIHIHFRALYYIPLILKRTKKIKVHFLMDFNILYDAAMPLGLMCVLIYKDYRLSVVCFISLLLFATPNYYTKK